MYTTIITLRSRVPMKCVLEMAVNQDQYDISVHSDNDANLIAVKDGDRGLSQVVQPEIVSPDEMFEKLNFVKYYMKGIDGDKIIQYLRTNLDTVHSSLSMQMDMSLNVLSGALYNIDHQNAVGLHEIKELKEEVKKDRDENKRVADQLEQFNKKLDKFTIATESYNPVEEVVKRGISNNSYKFNQWLAKSSQQTVDSNECGLCGFSTNLNDDKKCMSLFEQNLNVEKVYLVGDGSVGPDNEIDSELFTESQRGLFNKSKHDYDDLTIYYPSLKTQRIGPLFGNLYSACVYKRSVFYVYMITIPEIGPGSYRIGNVKNMEDLKSYYYIVISNCYILNSLKKRGVSVYFLNGSQDDARDYKLIEETIMLSYIGEITFCQLDDDDVGVMINSFCVNYVNPNSSGEWLNELETIPEKDPELTGQGMNGFKIMEMPFKTEEHKKIGIELGKLNIDGITIGTVRSMNDSSNIKDILMKFKDDKPVGYCPRYILRTWPLRYNNPIGASSVCTRILINAGKMFFVCPDCGLVFNDQNDSLICTIYDRAFRGALTENHKVIPSITTRNRLKLKDLDKSLSKYYQKDGSIRLYEIDARRMGIIGQ